MLWSVEMKNTDFAYRQCAFLKTFALVMKHRHSWANHSVKDWWGIVDFL
jgi:hypothetical protein